MDQSLDPCNDFYQFSCGNFLKRGSVKYDHSYTSLNIIKKGMKEIKDLDEDSHDSKTLKKMHFFDQQCLHYGK